MSFNNSSDVVGLFTVSIMVLMALTIAFGFRFAVACLALLITLAVLYQFTPIAG